VTQAAAPFRAITVSATVLGRFSLVVDGHAEDVRHWPHRSAERFLKLLLITPGHRLRREAAAESLWPDAPHGRAAANLRRAWHFLRRAMDDDGEDLLLQSSRGELGFAARAEVTVDLDRLRRGMRRLSMTLANPSAAERHDDVDALEVVLLLGADELLPDDLDEEWTGLLREQLLVRWERAAILAAERAARSHRPARAQQLAEQVLERDPASEEAHRLLIRALMEEGLPHLARRQLLICRRALREAFDVEPGAETLAAVIVLPSGSATVVG
jgi:DNA-binding SARP family transcriptional activator